ncbi:MAG: archease [Candidatus Poseidonia sp.]|nr:archease [Poseidonia sp.]
MSAWIFPTTADVGLRTFGRDLSSLFIEAAQGMQQYLSSQKGFEEAERSVRHYGQWEVKWSHQPLDHSMLFITWLEEVLYRCEVHNQWFMEGMAKVEEVEDGLRFIAQVTWCDADVVEREVEIKAVTTHELLVSFVQPGDVVTSQWPDVPEFQGPGWYADVVFDI